MSILQKPRKVQQNAFRVQGANNGDYGVLIVPDGYTGVTVGLEGTAGSATVAVAYMNNGAVSAYTSGTITPTQQFAFETGVGAEVYVTIASATATTDLRIVGNAR